MFNKNRDLRLMLRIGFEINRFMSLNLLSVFSTLTLFVLQIDNRICKTVPKTYVRLQIYSAIHFSTHNYYSNYLIQQFVRKKINLLCEFFVLMFICMNNIKGLRDEIMHTIFIPRGFTFFLQVLNRINKSVRKFCSRSIEKKLILLFSANGNLCISFVNILGFSLLLLNFNI